MNCFGFCHIFANTAITHLECVLYCDASITASKTVSRIHKASFAKNAYDDERSSQAEVGMQVLGDFARTLGGLPLGALIALVVLGGFGLAAFAIHAVLVVTRDKQ